MYVNTVVLFSVEICTYACGLPHPVKALAGARL